MARTVDLAVHASWIVTINADNRVMRDHAVVVDGGKIIAIAPSDKVAADFTAAEVVTLPGQVVMPGLVNTHTHAAMSLMRGIADDLPLKSWLEDNIWPVEAKWVNHQFVADGTELAVAEMLLGGTTCFADQYFFTDAVAQVASRLGIRAAIGFAIIDFPTRWAETPDEYVSKGLAVRDEFKFDPLINFHFAPHAPYSVSDESLTSVRILADELELAVQMHVHETRREIETAVSETGARPLARLERLGLLSPQFIAVHVTQVTTDEIGNLAANGVQVVHCPESNMKLASGTCPVVELMAAGVNVSLGTDGAASNNDLDMFGEMRVAALLAKNVTGNPEAVGAAEALRIATINGARTLGLEHQIGSLEPGKAADMIAVDLSRLATQPVYEPTSQLVYSATRDHVSNVWVSGNQRVKDGELQNVDVGTLTSRAEHWANQIRNSRNA